MAERAGYDSRQNNRATSSKSVFGLVVWRGPAGQDLYALPPRNCGGSYSCTRAHPIGRAHHSTDDTLFAPCMCAAVGCRGGVNACGSQEDRRGPARKKRVSAIALTPLPYTSCKGDRD